MLHPLLALLLIALLALRPTSLAGTPPPKAWEPDSVADAFASPSAALLWPGATRAYFVDSDGNLGNGVWRVDVAAGADGQPASSPRRIAYEDRWMPVAHWTEHAGGVRWEFEAVALPVPQSLIAEWRGALARGHMPSFQDDQYVDVPLVVSVCATAHNDGARVARATLGVAFARARANGAIADADAPARLPACGWWNADADSAIGWSDAPVQGRRVHRELTLEPGQSSAVRFVVTSHPVAGSMLADWARVPHETRARMARDWWTLELSHGTRLRLDDPEVEGAVRAARVVLLSGRERREGHWSALSAPFAGRGANSTDHLRALSALEAHGYVEAAGNSGRTLDWLQPTFAASAAMARAVEDGEPGLSALRTGRRAEADSALTELLWWRNACGAGNTMFAPAEDLATPPPPSLRSSAALLQLVRNSLIDDSGPRLCLTEGARPHWWHNARVDGAPTRWGTISLAFERTDERAHWRWTAVPVWTELVLPPGTQVAGELKAPLLRGPRPDVVLAPPGTQQARVTLARASRGVNGAVRGRATIATRADIAGAAARGL